MLKKAKLRYNEYYDMQKVFDSLYAASKNNNNFYKLLEIIGSEANIRLAYRNLKTNDGSNTAGPDGMTIDDIKEMSDEQVVQNVRNMLSDYRPKPVRRVFNDKPGSNKKRPLGIPCIWDRLVQQCILQVLEPICEPQFHPHSYGFRPNRSTSHAIARVISLINVSKHYYCVDIDIKGFFDKKIPAHVTGRIRYNPVSMLKTVLFGFMSDGYISLRSLEDNCRVNMRYMYLMDYATPSYRTFGYFINEVLADSVEDLFNEINRVIFKKEHVDLNHLYIDGSKFEANANKYTWVWKKATEKSRYRLFAKITSLFEEMNKDLAWSKVKIQTNTEYNPEYLETVLKKFTELWKLDPADFVHGIGHRKTVQQRQYELLKAYTEKLHEYVEKLDICGEGRNSYSKTDHSATFMRIKRDYMGNDQLLPAYNVQFGVADEYIAVADVNQYRADMDCFVPLMELFHKTYGFYPKYPIADAGYGSYNNYIYCQQHGMEKYMKFPMYDKETKDSKYHDNPFRSVNFKIDEQGKLRCPNGQAFHFKYRKLVRGNQYGRQEEVYECDDCSGCPYAEKCKHTPNNRTIRLNEELTFMHKEVLNNLESIQGALLRMNRSIQAEGTFGIIKNDRWYKRIVRRGIKSVRLEVFLVAIGHNLYKYANKTSRLRLAA